LLDGVERDEHVEFYSGGGLHGCGRQAAGLQTAGCRAADRGRGRQAGRIGFGVDTIVSMRRTFSSLLLVLLAASTASAQAQQPIPPFVIDVRGFFAGLGQDPVTAEDLAVDPESLPGRALGGAVGLTFYPIRRQSFAIGIGGEGLIARGRSQPVDAAGVPLGLPIERRLQSLAGQVSFNFGHRDGWSYISAGMGPLLFETFLGDAAPAVSPPRDTTLNFGGGARWFTSRHLAFCFDLRFYETKPAITTLTNAGRERKRILVLSAGVGFK
jgi:hypothetical protein